jgi:NADPH2:quinone reductase
MRAIVLTEICPPEALRITEVPVPAVPADGALIRVAYCALNPLDTHARAGRIKWGVPAMPFTLGYEYAGRVEQVGADVDPSWVGRRVCVFGQWGGCADYAVAPARALNAVPEGLPWAAAAAFFTTTYTAWHLVHTAAAVQTGQVAVVHSAAGSVGVMLTQILKEAGARVIGLTSSQAKADWAARFGADDWVITSEQSFEAAVKTLTSGRGADVIFDGVQGSEAPKNLACLAPFGRVFYIGAMGGLAPHVNVSQLIAGSIGVHGFVIQHAMARTAGAETPLIDEALVNGRWKLALNEPRPLEEAGSAHAQFEGRQTMGRTLLRVGGDL